jgi:hypothetical protein
MTAFEKIVESENASLTRDYFEYAAHALAILEPATQELQTNYANNTGERIHNTRRKGQIKEAQLLTADIETLCDILGKKSILPLASSKRM